MSSTKQRSPMSSFCAYTTFLKAHLNRVLTTDEYSAIMKLYILATPVETTLEILKAKEG